jgi:alkanesulfonate monooxygenase SsuD/methylene tetrahydromethanopterin reductase-like flavin-dependent oxidoreductase (luciferase family)
MTTPKNENSEAEVGKFDVILRVPIMIRINGVVADSPEEAAKKAYEDNMAEVRSYVRGHRKAPNAGLVAWPLLDPPGLVYMEEDDRGDGGAATVFRAGTYDDEKDVELP